MGKKKQSLDSKCRDKAGEIITCGNISTAVWYLAWPTVINTVFQTAYNIINQVFLGDLESSKIAQAALGVGQIAPMIQFAVLVGLSVGTSALTSRFLGAQQYEDADEVTRQSLIFGFFGGILNMIPLMLLAVPFVTLIGARGPVVPLAADYMWIIGAFSVPLYILVIATAALRSAGDARSPLYTSAVVVGVNILLDYILIFGVGPFPAMGVRGAALATGISRVAGMIMVLIFLRRSILRGAFAHLRVHVQWFLRIINIGWPAGMQHLLYSTGLAAFLWILGKVPEAAAAQAAITVGITIESAAFMPSVAYSMAATPLVGQNLGAGKPKRAEHCAWVATGQAAVITTLIAIIFLVFPVQLAHIFTRDPEVVRLIVSYLRINAICQPALGIGVVLAGALQGAGDTRFPTWVEVITNYIIRLPLTWFLTRTMGLNTTGAWIGMCSSNIIFGTLIVAWFRKGHWRSIRL
jgi:putative MATE family efflux protein